MRVEYVQTNTLLPSHIHSHTSFNQHFPPYLQGVRDRERGQDTDKSLRGVGKEAWRAKTQGEMNFTEGQITVKLERVLERLMRAHQQNTQQQPQQTTPAASLSYVEVEDDTLFHKLHTQIHHHITNTKKGESDIT